MRRHDRSACSHSCSRVSPYAFGARKASGECAGAISCFRRHFRSSRTRQRIARRTACRWSSRQACVALRATRGRPQWIVTRARWNRCGSRARRWTGCPVSFRTFARPMSASWRESSSNVPRGISDGSLCWRRSSSGRAALRSRVSPCGQTPRFSSTSWDLARVGIAPKISRSGAAGCRPRTRRSWERRRARRLPPTSRLPNSTLRMSMRCSWSRSTMRIPTIRHQSHRSSARKVSIPTAAVRRISMVRTNSKPTSMRSNRWISVRCSADRRAPSPS